MNLRRILLSLTVATAAAAPVAAPAQWVNPPRQQVQWPDPPTTQPAPKPAPRAQSQDVEELTPGQIRRAQEGAGAQPKAAAPKAVPKPRPKPKHRTTHSVACRGAFAKNSSHQRLVKIFGAHNVTFAAVDGPDNTKLMASVLFPKDPPQRLEVLWENEAERSTVSVIAINGRSKWMAPRGLHLGMSLAAIEKLNHKPFKLKGFTGNASSVLDWQGGTLASMPGGCKVGMRLVMNTRAPQAARKRVADRKEFVSSDAGLRAVRPAVVEILIGY
jgi:hypothetical protein